MAITRFDGEHRWLSNFAKCEIKYEGLTYWSVEHAYQAAKTLDPKMRKALSIGGGTEVSHNPGKAKILGRRVPLRPDWEDRKLEIMKQLLWLKFEQSPFMEQLLATRDQELVEGNDWGDTYWGVCRGRGENHLGKLLMEIREELGEFFYV